MRVFFSVAVYTWLSVGCSSSPTAPTPPPLVVTPPAVVTPTDDGLTRDPRFSLTFYRAFALGANDGHLQPLKRMAQAPFIHLMTVDQAGAPVDARTLDSVAAALINTTGELTGRFGLEGMVRGSNAAPERPNQITVVFSPDPNAQACGSTTVGGRSLTLYYRVRVCQCEGVIRSLTVKHELGHVLGFHHTGDATDLMSGLSVAGCDMPPSDREKYHALVAYSRPIGSFDP